MTLRMLDAINVDALPAGADAYAGYVDGKWQTYPQLEQKFPGARLLSIAVFAADDAEALDVENGDAVASQTPGWTRRQQHRGVQRPALYASVLNMGPILEALRTDGIARSSVRLWSAHYEAGQHICGPDTCKLIGEPMDGTQWTDKAPGELGLPVDASELDDSFFLSWQEIMMRQLPTVRYGDHGPDVATVQGLCIAREHPVRVDGLFGPATEIAVKAVQTGAHLTSDGVVGPATWPVLLDV